MRVKLSENLKRLRREREMMQEQLAEVMGVSISAVYKWESNHSTPEINLIFGGGRPIPYLDRYRMHSVL